MPLTALTKPAVLSSVTRHLLSNEGAQIWGRPKVNEKAQNCLVGLELIERSRADSTDSMDGCQSKNNFAKKYTRFVNVVETSNR